jgi:hypothetical protein
MTQRFITGLDVFDTYSGALGTIQEVNLSATANPSLAPAYTGAYFIVLISTVPQVFTIEGKRVDHITGSVLDGITLLTKFEYLALVSAGYPK